MPRPHTRTFIARTRRAQSEGWRSYGERRYWTRRWQTPMWARELYSEIGGWPERERPDSLMSRRTTDIVNGPRVDHERQNTGQGSTWMARSTRALKRARAR